MTNIAAPPGISKLIEQCQQIYPDQLNPLQVTTILKYWLGGQDPLDYISMYSNPGNPDLNIPPHWHYISFGLSDLHGDGRVHQPETSGNPEPRSGMGFELTFRLIKNQETKSTEADQQRPPTWPANLLQALASYVFQTGNRLCAGDNVPWRKSLDNSKSQIQHMLIAEDPQLPRIETPFGWVDFCQIVGVTFEELEKASKWNGKGILNLLKADPSTGGEWLITDMDRQQSVFQMFPETLRQLELDLEREGSDLAGVNAEFTFTESHNIKIKQESDSNALNEHLKEENKINQNLEENVEIKKELDTNSPFPSYINNSLSMSCPIDSQPQGPSRVIPLEGLELTLAPNAAKFLVLAIKDRIRHGRHFTFKSEHLAVTFVAESVTGSVVTKSSPFAVIGYWMQVLIPDDLVSRMLDSLWSLERNPDNLCLPAIFEWPDKNLKIVIDDLPVPETFKEESANQ